MGYVQFVPCFQTRHTFHRPIQIGWKAKGYRRLFKLVRVYNFRVGAGSLVDSYYRESGSDSRNGGKTKEIRHERVFSISPLVAV